MNGSKNPPDWTIPAGKVLAQAAARIRLIAAVTPSNLMSELSRMEQSFSRERGGDARFEYAPAKAGFDELANALLNAADMFEGFENEEGLGLLYAERARELAVEAMLCVSVGTPAFLHWARKRFARRDEYDGQADKLAKDWLCAAQEHRNELECDNILSDDERDCRSLLQQMRKAVGERCLGFRVVPVLDLAPLASTGEGVIYVASGRRLSLRDIERTVLHEIEGHALPADRAGRFSLSILKVGTARGSDDQEGRAIRLESTKNFLDAGRRRELALRHMAARAAQDGAIFSDIVKILLDFGVDIAGALRIGARVCRGGGLARESVYLPAYLRVMDAIQKDACVDRLLGSGRVSVQSAQILRPWI